jgi:PAS domain S-box-containing protein
MTHKSAQSQTPTFLVQEGSERVARSAQSLLRDLEQGRIGLDTAVQVAPDRAPQPLRLFLRQLVWLSDASQQQDRGTDEVVLSLKREVFDSAPVGLVVSDLRGKVTEANAAFARLVARPRESLEGMLVGELSEPEDHKRERMLGNQMLFGERPFVHVEKRFVRPDGTEVPCLMGLSLLRNDKGEPRSVIGVVVDLSEQRQLEALRARVGEAGAVQRLARSVAHDLANLMTVVTLSTHFLEDCVDQADSDASESLSAIQQAAELCQALTARLRDLSQVGTPVSQALDLRLALQELAPVLRKVVGHPGALSLRLPSEPSWSAISKADLKTILLNLTVNAAQALKPGGTVEIVLERGPSQHRLRVQDNGCGMPPEVLKRFLEPEFSTKPSGSGLGMSIITTALARLGGHLDVDSAVDVGTTMTLNIPSAGIADIKPPIGTSAG